MKKALSMRLINVSDSSEEDLSLVFDLQTIKLAKIYVLYVLSFWRLHILSN